MKKIQLIITLLFFATSLFAQTNMADTALIIKGATLPFFNILNPDSSVVSTAQIPNEKNVVLVLFNPSCGHCQTVGKQINDSINMFPNTHFIFVAGLPTYYLFKEFTDYTKIKKSSNVFVGADYSNITPAIFAFNGIPQIMIYGADKKLKQIFYKEITMQNLYNAVNDIPVVIKPTKKKKRLFGKRK